MRAKATKVMINIMALSQGLIFLLPDEDSSLAANSAPRRLVSSIISSSSGVRYFDIVSVGFWYNTNVSKILTQRLLFSFLRGYLCGMKRSELIEKIFVAGTSLYEEREARNMAYAVAEDIYGVTRTQLVVEPSAVVDTIGKTDVEEVCRRIAAGEPHQYVAGYSEFCSLRFEVSPAVLIPRPETEELVAWIADDYAGHERLSLLDIGTGSGAIAVALAHRLGEASVDAIDISSSALEVAQRNAAANMVEVRFMQGDILEPLSEAMLNERYDIIVSNPPYIPAAEVALMRDNVTKHEPSGALFVPDNDPLLFYRTIGERALGMLKEGGALYFEIHEGYADEVCKLLEEQGFSAVECRNDINDKPRMVKCLRE